MAEIRINHASATRRAGEIRNAAPGVGPISTNISPTDDMSTIAANQGAKDAFRDARSTLRSFGSAVRQGGTAIQSVSQTFVAADTLEGIGPR